MNKTSRKTIALSGCETRKPRDFRVLLNYYIAVLLNQSKLNPNQLPIHYCNPSVYPDYLAMNTEPGKFHHSPLTGLAFYSYDYTFDRQDGLYNAIHYNNKRQLASYKEKYKDLPFVIAPDYSIFDDIWRYENEYRLFKTRILMLWFELEIGAVVIPNAIYVAPDKMPLYYSGLENCSVICFSTKGHIRRAESRNRVKEAVQFVTDNMTNLNTILVYSVCGNDHNSLRLFQYAAERGIQILIVDNTLRQRNKALMKRRADHE